jgi:excisionase family DNA binding protein
MDIQNKVARAEPEPGATSPPLSKIFYSLAETTAALGLSRSYLFGLLAEGRLHAVKCGGRTLVPAEELKRFAHSLPEAGYRQEMGSSDD